MTDETEQTIEAPEEIPEQTRFDLIGQGYKPEEQLVVLLAHDAPWERRRDVEVGADGGFNLVSFSHIPGKITVSVLRPGENVEPLATTTIKVRVATAEEVAANAKPSDSTSKPEDCEHRWSVKGSGGEVICGKCSVTQTPEQAIAALGVPGDDADENDSE